jgi:hypothetical protein
LKAYSIDLLYAWTQLGLEEGASLEEIEAALENTARLSTNGTTQHYVDFFHAREKLGGLTADFSIIRKTYHRTAFALHPDRNKGNAAAEEQLKEINAAYGLIDDIYRKAKAWNKREKQNARKSAAGETTTPHAAPPHGASATNANSYGQTTRQAERKYVAVAIPRSIRVARLGYLPLQTIIGSFAIVKENDLNLVFDVIMLPIAQYRHAKAHLAAPTTPGISLQYGKFDPPYIPHNVKEFTAPPDALDSESAARDYFKKLFGL